ncbi:hypothetical protein [Acidovorax delafieldii]|uniref:hypothetical protein n=1 Tax=Acidovorax delafieldii TaxID=47920 RepID=UPI0002FE1E4F|nr:hypothetical protein [Acidovorax delafieldii]
MSSRVAQICDVESLLDRLPDFANKNLRNFIADVFDQALVSAYATQINGAWAFGCSQPAGHSLLDWSLQAAEQAWRHPALRAWEREVAATAALIAPCGLAGFLRDRPDRNPVSSLSRDARKEIAARRLVILEAALRCLRSRDADIGRTLGAVLDVTNDEELDRQQVARITAAIGCMAVL